MARAAVVCPKCGTLNRSTWEFCVRCNTSLEGAQPAEGPAPRPAPVQPDSQPSSIANALAFLAFLAFLVGGVWAWKTAANTPLPKGPDPGLFTMGTQPAQIPTPAPPPPELADYEAGSQALMRGDLAEAVARLSAAVAADPDNAEFRRTYAHALWRSGDRDRSLGEEAVAARIDPRLQAHYAQALDAAGRSEDAAREYEEVLRKNPEATSIREELGRLLVRTGDYTRAATLLQQAVQDRPDDPVLEQDLAFALDHTGNRAEAETVYRGILAQVPQAAMTRTLLVDNLLGQGRKAEAMTILQEGLQRPSAPPFLHREMGRLLEGSGRAAEAVAAYREYARLAPNAPDAQEMAERATRLEAALTARASAS